ncbi:hypothetical protein ADIS_2980 [Lunatimonas lonarensis]|uniref:Glycoside hydrolase family 2 catalytic domain-containing protein n=1 Tax=Lunatimonas lonarensis TaxID=1232681 RepID=R7ZQY7_9BACT|nr:glycoside hydrolase family 2 TIM barrel-domain containing protein [Lunatimonas lonarensis]EON76530.1 hypothetical protein ADIS_2980 [Lunatimonas lonarensis]
MQRTNITFISLAKILFFFTILVNFSCKKNESSGISPKVEVKYEGKKAILYRNGSPYHIKGGGGMEHFEQLASIGGNSVRTWSLYDADSILDEAQKHGLTVTLGIEIGRPHWGVDFNYWNWTEVNKKIEELKPVIEKYKSHPALLMWGVGNEVELQGGNKYLIYFIINRIAKMIKEIDPDHPTLTAVNSRIVGRSRYLLPSIDIMGYNGFDLIPEFYERNKNYRSDGWGRAYVFTEWGPPGHWEVQETEWGAPLEMEVGDKVKYLEWYWDLMNQDTLAFLGSYSFFWGNKTEITPTWFSHFSPEGAKSETFAFLQTKWTGRAPQNLPPRVSPILLNEKTPPWNTYLVSDSLYTVSATVTDPENDPITYKWEIWPEEIQFHGKNIYHYNMVDQFVNNDSSSVVFKAPKNDGAYRLYVYAFDDHENFGYVNLPFYVINR